MAHVDATFVLVRKNNLILQSIASFYFVNLKTQLLSHLTEQQQHDKRKTQFKILTSVPLYIKPAIGFRSFGCCLWSESLSWHKTVSFITGPMLIDLHLLSMVHRFLQWLCICIPAYNVMFVITWPTSACPSICSKNLTRLQISRKEFGECTDKYHYYSFKIFLRFWLAFISRLIPANRLATTKFGRRFYYWTIDVIIIARLTSIVQ